MTDHSDEPIEDPTESSEEEQTPLQCLVETMNSVHDPDKIIEKSFFNSLILVVFGLPYLGHVEGWASGWAYLWQPLLHVTIACIAVEIIKSVAPVFRNSKQGLTVSHGLSIAAMMAVLYCVWAPLTSTLIAGGAVIAVFLILVPIQIKKDRIAATELRLSPRLLTELKALPDSPLHSRVDAPLQTAATERTELQRVLNDSLKDDGAIDGLGILREYDAGFADMLDRSHPLTTLLNQGGSGSVAAQTQAEEGLKVFTSVAEGIHSLAVLVLGYAGSRDSDALDDLKHRTQDLRTARKAHNEIQSHLDPT